MEDIITPETKAVVADVVSRSNGESTSWEWPGHVYDARDDFGKAILSTVHGKAVVWLLASHKHQFGLAAITKINIFGTPDTFNLYFAIEENSPAATEVSSQAAIKHVKRVNDANPMTDEEWEDRVEQGNSLVCLLAADVDGANRMMNIETQSTWLFAEDFDDYGWTLLEDTDSGTKQIQYRDVLRSLGLSEDKDDWQQLTAIHEHRWTQDGQELPVGRRMMPL